MYNSFFNITSYWLNNQLQIRWPGISSSFSVTIPDGYYSYGDLTSFLQFTCLQNKLYLVDAQNKPYFYISIAENQTSYSAQVTITPVPTAAQASALGLSLPPGATWAFPGSAATPQLILGSPQLGKIMGFSSQLLTLPPVVQGSTYAVLSDTFPTVSPVSSIVVACNLVHSGLSLHPNLLSQLPINSSFGSLVTNNNGIPQQVSIMPSSFANIDIWLLDQNLTELRMKDLEFTCCLVIEY